METKRFIVVDTRNNRTTSFDSVAITVAELKADMQENGIDPTGMLIQEGLTKTEFTSDDQVLPQNVPYKGGTTNNLVFRLTYENRKIKSGVYSRAEAYAKVKEYGLQEDVKDYFGKNYTIVGTDDLNVYIANYESLLDDNEEDNDVDEDTEMEETAVCSPFTALLDVLVAKNVLTLEEKNIILKHDAEFSKAEIDALFRDM